MSTKETHKVTLMSVTAADAKNPTIHVKTIGRNDPGPCGSGKKVKNCCGETKQYCYIKKKEVAKTTKTNRGLVQYCLAQLGRPYWYGTFGQLATPSLLVQKRQQYPKYYTANDFASQMGQKVHDCIGLIKGYMWCKDVNDTKPVYADPAFPDISADGLYRHCVRKGEGIETMPDVPGIAVFMKGHVGVYVGDGQVIEARGHAYGVVMTELKRRAWKRWAYIEEIKYL